jgi:hypothetical protein
MSGEIPCADRGKNGFDKPRKDENERQRSA